MAKRTNTTRPHSAPGLYFKDSVQTYSNKSLGITTLGVAGETLRGPAFQPISISNWREFQTYFGGTSTAKFKGSQYPKYELPYIAKSYLEQSNQLEVVRVLGLSGVNAGPAWVITATKHKVFTGYDYSLISSDPYKDDPSQWNASMTYNKETMPKPPAIDETYPEYIRVISEYEWHTLCTDCEGITIDHTYDLTDPSNNNVPDVNDRTCTYNHIKVIQSYWYTRLEHTPSNPNDYTVVTTQPTPNYAAPAHIRIANVEGTPSADEYTYFDLENVAYCYEKETVYNYYHKLWQSGIQLEEEDYCEGNHNNMVVAVLRSRGQHKKAAFVRTPTDADIANGYCDDIYSYDGIEYFAKEMRLEPSKSLTLGSSCNPGFSSVTGDFTVDNFNYGTFTIVVDTIYGETKYYSVSLNPGEKNYIYNVIGGNPEEGDAEIYVEELYDVALRQLIEEGKFNAINSEVIKYPAVNIIPKYADVNDIITDSVLSKKYRGKRYLYSTELSAGISVRYTEDGGVTWYEGEGINGVIYTVFEHTNQTTGKKEYFYGSYTDAIKFQYDLYYGDTRDINWIECRQTLTNEQQNVFIDNCPYFDKATTTTPQYVKIINPTNFTEAGKLVTVEDDGTVKIGTNIVSEKAVTYYPFHQVLDLSAMTGNVASITITLPKSYSGTDMPFEVYSYSNQEMHLYEYNWSKGENNTYTATNVLAVPGAKYDFIIYTKVDGTYTVSVTDTNDNTIDTQITVNDNDGIVYVKKVIDITDSTKAKKATERLTKYNYNTDVVDGKFTNCVKVLADNVVYVNTENGKGGYDVFPITLDFNNYKEQYRYASTPWIVSEIKGSAEQVQLAKLFRFHTISDGSNSSLEVKVSIENIDPSTGKFDVVVRNFNDTDLNVNAVERFVGCTLVPGDPDYIALKIGSFDESYNAVSNYITVEVIENDITKNSIPAGFLGYPMRNYNGFVIKGAEYKYVLMSTVPSMYVVKTSVPYYVYDNDPQYIKVDENYYEKVNKLTTNPTQPYFKFNTDVDEDIKIKKQYFGVSDLIGIDTDALTYKGVEAYNEVPAGMTPCFHLDARILNGTPNADGEIENGELKQTVSVDGITGYSWVTVNKNLTTSEGIEPRIGSESVMTGTVYEDKKYRKFTVAFYGGWDGWDYYRTYRSNTNEYRAKEYKGYINTVSGYGDMFNVIKNPEAFDFDTNEKVINSDYYAYLAGVRQFNNPKSIAINVLATPGIDYVNNGQLVNEVIDMVEEDRQDCVYVVTTPDKPFGASDSKDDMYDADEAVANLEDSDIDSNHTTTYYPWVKYFDADNSDYIYLPITRDVVKSIALTDNQAFPWFASAGWTRGPISGDSPKRRLKQGEQDTLYDGRINFVASFAGEDFGDEKVTDRIWGDKNLQIADNQLNRLSARRLLLRIKRMLQTSCIGLIFDPNDNNQTKAIRSSVGTVLDYVKENRGITDWKIEIDDSPSTTDQLGRGVTYYIRRSPMLEWISFTSVLSANGMEW